jgi:hypothetical protein
MVAGMDGTRVFRSRLLSIHRPAGVGEALQSDWYAVGRDIRVAARRYDKAARTKTGAQGDQA